MPLSFAKAKEQERLDKTLGAFYETIEHFNVESKKSLTFNASGLPN